MIKKTLVNVGVAALLGGMAVAAQAATMKLSNFAYNSTGHNVGAVNTNVPTFNFTGPAGGFKGELSGAPGFNTTNLLTYCVEVTETFSFGTSYNNFTILNASTYFNNTARVQKLERLISYVFGTNLFGTTGASWRDEQSAALQLAIWNTVYDTDNTLSGGNLQGNASFSSNTTNYLGANQLLANSAATPITYSLFVLSSGKPFQPNVSGNQDQLFWLEGGGQTTGSVPEPTSLALAFGALGALGLAVRRRQAPRV